MLQKIFIVRHAEYDGVGDKAPINDTGRRKMTDLLEKIKPHCNGHTAIITSPHKRAFQSAEILAAGLQVKIIQLAAELISNDRHCDPVPVLPLIRERADKGAEVVILVTHLELTGALPRYIGGQELNGTKFPYKELQKATAWHIDCTTNTCELMK